MRYSVIDCGSNSFRLIVVDVADGKMTELFRDLKMVQLGSNLQASGGIIDAQTENRCLSALKQFKEISNNYDCLETFCVGTSALRSANNAADFCQKVFNEIGINIEIVDGDTEAWYSYCGATESTELVAGIAVLDIGGGSSEIAFSTERSLLSASIKAGSVRLSNVYADTNYQIDHVKLQELKNYVKALWDIQWKDKCLDIKRFIGVAGTITTLSAIKLKMKQYDPNAINGSFLTYTEIEKIYNKLNKLSVDDRLKVDGLNSRKRAQIIVAGTAILLATMEYFNEQEIEVRDTCLLQGVVFDKILYKNN